MKGAVAFATLFFGLTVGNHPLEVLVGREVQRVEIQLDGERIAELRGWPWKTVGHLGDLLEPRNLEAIAFDKKGVEIGRATQWLNIPQPPAQARILLDTDPSSGRVTASLRSDSVLNEVPQTVSAFFDGQPIAATDSEHIVLPEHDPQQLHYLRVDFVFPDGLASSVERTFGGSFSDQVAAELTAVPLDLDKNAQPIEARPEGWLRARGKALTVVDVVQGPAEVILVRDQSAQRQIDRMVRRNLGDVRAVASLKRDYSLTFLRPVAERVERKDGDMRLFKPSAPLTSNDGGLFWLLTVLRAAEVPPRMQRLSDALAVAGLSAAADGHRRAVILLLGPEPADHGQYSPDGVRHYLESMHVPLFVWSTEGARDTPWGPALDASSMHKIERLTKQVVKSVERQHIAWVRGVYLPPEVTLAENTAGIRFAGS